jgi:hypothetical protein
VLNPSSIESIMRIYRFYKKAQDKDDSSNEGALLEKIFKEFRGDRISTLTDADIEVMKQDVPIEILIK